jgi:hypothetical protein
VQNTWEEIKTRRYNISTLENHKTCMKEVAEETRMWKCITHL